MLCHGFRGRQQRGQPRQPGARSVEIVVLGATGAAVVVVTGASDVVGSAVVGTVTRLSDCGVALVHDAARAHTAATASDTERAVLAATTVCQTTAVRRGPLTALVIAGILPLLAVEACGRPDSNAVPGIAAPGAVPSPAGPIPVLDVVDDAIEEALRQGVDVNVVFEPEARDAIEGLAGLLRFR